MQTNGTTSVHGSADLTEDHSVGLIDAEIDPVWTFGYGIGKYFSRNVRGDVTFELRQDTDVTARRRYTGQPERHRDFEIKSNLMLANVYYDFGDRTRFSPYVGVGVGAVLHVTKPGGLASETGASGIVYSDTKWSAAFAAMVGASLNMSDTAGFRIPGAHIDVGYRFLYLGDAGTGVLTAPGVSVASGIEIDGITAHEMRFGVRYDLQ